MSEDFTVEQFENALEGWSMMKKYYGVFGNIGFFNALWENEDNIQTEFGSVKRFSTETDYDDGREERVIIFGVDGRYFRKTGYYDSWGDIEWDGELIEVKPVEKTFIVYERL